MTKKIVLDVPLTIRNVIDIKQIILDGFELSDDLSLSLDENVTADMCGLQLIEAARRHAVSTGKRLALAEPAFGLRTLLEEAGFLGTGACPERGFWLHEGASR